MMNEDKVIEGAGALSHMAYMSGIDAGGAGRNEAQCR